ncbi:MAG: Fe-S protein assembly co-chaperone HscB [Endozoicomonas sp.]
MVEITKNFFELFQIPVACHVDSALLAGKYRELQKAVHPDRFAGESERQQRLSIQYAAYVNEGYETLKSPLKRSLYLLKMAGNPVNLESNTVMDPGFLMEQMELRESMSELRDSKDPEEELERLIESVDKGIDGLHQQFERHWQAGDEAGLDAAEALVRKMQFMVKLAAELEQLESELLDN